MVGYKGRAGYGGDKASQVDLYKFKVGNEEILGIGRQCGTKGQGEMSEGYSVQRRIRGKCANQLVSKVYSIGTLIYVVTEVDRERKSERGRQKKERR
jgi:hypothetical protein